MYATIMAKVLSLYRQIIYASIGVQVFEVHVVMYRDNTCMSPDPSTGFRFLPLFFPHTPQPSCTFLPFFYQLLLPFTSFCFCSDLFPTFLPPTASLPLWNMFPAVQYTSDIIIEPSAHFCLISYHLYILTFVCI